MSSKYNVYKYKGATIYIDACIMFIFKYRFNKLVFSESKSRRQ